MHILGNLIDYYDPDGPDNYRKCYEIEGQQVAVEYYDTQRQEEV
jgi:hypothetical protein